VNLGQEPACRTVRTACSLDCPDACGVIARVEGDRIVSLRGDPEHPFTRGALCQKVNRYLETRLYHPERQLYPLRRTRTGWKRVSWDEALDEAAERLATARAEHGSLSLLYHRGNGSMAALKWVMLDRFCNLFGGATEAVGRYCAGEGDLGLVQTFGDAQMHDPLDLEENSQMLLIWGRNPAVTNIHLMPILKRARARGALAVVVDPIATKTVRYVDRHVQLRPGSDAWLAVGTAKVILERNPPDHARIRQLASGYDEFERAVRETPMEDVVRRTGVEAEEIQWLAGEYASRRPAALLPGIGLQQYTTGAQTYRFISALAMITGNIGVPGGGVSAGAYAWQYLKTRAMTALDARTTPVRTLRVSRLAEALAAPPDPPVRTALFMASNLVNQMPDPEATRRELAKLDFVVVADQFLTDTADCAHLFFPSTNWLEEADYLPSYGHLWVQLMQPVAPPPGEARPDLSILQGLADRLGFGEQMAGDASYWIDRVTEPWREDGVSYEALREAGGRLWPRRTPRVPFADGKFPTPDGRFHFPVRFEDDPVLPPPDYPQHLVAQATDKGTNSQLTSDLQQGEIGAGVHPALAAEVGVKDGDLAWLTSARGRLRVAVRLDPTTRPDTIVLLKGGWWKRGRNMNVLVEPRFTPGTGVAHNQNYVRLERA